MPRKPEPLEPWMLEAINLIVRQILTLRQAVHQLGVDITPQQADNIQGRMRFQGALEEARLKYYPAVGANPRLTKDAVVGQLFMLAQRLATDGEDAKAADTLLKVAKVQNWTSGEDYKDKPVFGNLSQADIDRLKAEVRAKRDAERSPATERSQGDVNEKASAKVN
jgi:hypothetical protein